METCSNQDSQSAIVMEHSYFRDRISAFKDNGLNTEEQYLISLHLKECAECRALLEKLEALDSMVARESELSPDEYFEKLASMIDKKIAGDSAKVTDISTRSSWTGLTWKITAMAASVAFLVFIGYHKDDILPPSSLKTMSESPVIMAPGSTVKVDSIRTRRQDKAEEQPASFSSPKPSPAELRSPSAADGYLSERDAVGKSDDAQGDVDWTFSRDEKDQLQENKTEVRGERKTISEKSSIVKENPATEKIFIRGGRANEVEFELDDVSLDKAEESPKGLFQEAAQKNERARETFKLLAPELKPDIAPEPVDEQDSNYKQAQKTALAVEEKAADKKKLITDAFGNVMDLTGIQMTEGTIHIRDGRMREQFRNTRDSLIRAWPQFDNQRVKDSDEKKRLYEKSQLSVSDRYTALEEELLDLLQNIIRVSKDSSETDRAVIIVAEMAEFGFDDMRLKAKLYLDSLEAARSKSNQKPN